MQFFSTLVLSTLALSSAIVATPAPIERALVAERDIVAERDLKLFSVISGILGSLNTGLPSLSTSISSSCSSVSTTSFDTHKGKKILAEVEGLISAKIDLITSLLGGQTNTLTGQISSLGLTSTTSTLSCTPGDIAELITALQSATSLIATIKADVLSAIIGISVLKTALEAKLSAVEAAVESFFNPLLTAALAAKLSATTDVTGLISAISAFKLIFAGIKSGSTCL